MDDPNLINETFTSIESDIIDMQITINSLRTAMFKYGLQDHYIEDLVKIDSKLEGFYAKAGTFKEAYFRGEISDDFALANSATLVDKLGDMQKKISVISNGVPITMLGPKHVVSSSVEEITPSEFNACNKNFTATGEDSVNSPYSTGSGSRNNKEEKKKGKKKL